MGWATVPLLPTVTRVPTTATSVPFGSNDPDVANLAQFGYVQEEFFISSTVGGTPYTTRILVRRPANPKKFSGIIIAESIRSTAIRTLWGVRAYLMRSGHAYVELGSNLSGINRFVKPSDPTRYAAINLPHPAYPLLFGHIHEIMAQGGRLLKTNAPGGPFAGFPVKHVLLGGCSEQGLIVRMYMRDSHALYRMADGGPVYDGYFPACVADWPSWPNTAYGPACFGSRSFAYGVWQAVQPDER